MRKGDEVDGLAFTEAGELVFSVLNTKHDHYGHVGHQALGGLVGIHGAVDWHPRGVLAVGGFVWSPLRIAYDAAGRLRLPEPAEAATPPPGNRWGGSPHACEALRPEVPIPGTASTLRLPAGAVALEVGCSTAGRRPTLNTQLGSLTWDL
jgi:hypothetical protein